MWNQVGNFYENDILNLVILYGTCFNIGENYRKNCLRYMRSYEHKFGKKNLMFPFVFLNDN